MGFRRKIKYFLVHQQNLSNKAAQELIAAGKIELNGVRIFENCILNPGDRLSIDSKIIFHEQFVYLKFHKPAGFQSTLNPVVTGNLSEFFREFTGMSIAGRLDQHSEGLLLLSNDGKWIEKICNPLFEKQKEYEVLLDKEPDGDFIENFRAGVMLGDGITRPCGCETIGEKLLRITLTEGRNRQIRRMCHKLGYQVINLKRTRIQSVYLSDLSESEVRHLTENELSKI